MLVNDLNYSENAAKVYKELWLKQDNNEEPIETIGQCHDRVAYYLAKTQTEYTWFKYLMDEQIFRVNTPCMTNAGIKTDPILSACFILGLEDSMESITDMWATITRIYEGGGGAGIPITNLRENRAKIDSGGRASGPLSYLKVNQAISEQVKSGGRSRRAANLISCKHDHPDAIEIIKCKRDKQSFNAMNISVLVDDQFMSSIMDVDKYRAPKHTVISPKHGPLYYQDSLELWNEILESAWQMGDPGLLFYDRVNEDNPCPSLGDIVTTNPCFTGDTKVWTIYGPKTFRELAKEGKDVPVLSQNDEGKLEFKMMKNPRRSRKIKQELVRVHFDDGRYLDCTPDHEWYVRSKNKGIVKTKAKNLKPNQSISSVYRYNANQHGRKRLTNGIEDPLQHHVVVEWKESRRPEYPFEHCHHIDKDKTNDVPENLKIMDASEHNAESMYGEQNPMHGIWDERNPLYKDDFNGKNNPRYYHHITKEMVLDLKKRGYTQQQMCEKLGCSKKVIRDRLGNNHKVAYVERLAEKRTVYNGTVEDNHNYFVMVGDNDAVLVANCGEVPGPPWTECVLGHINLNKILTSDGCTDPEVSWKNFHTYIYWATLMLNRIIDRTHHPNENFRKMMQRIRPIGLGIMGLADFLCELGIKYGSDEALSITSEITEFLTRHAYRASIEFAESGVCDCIDIPKEDVKHFNSMLHKFGVSTDPTTEPVISNSLVTCIAPTGSTSISADCSYGFEPHFAVVWEKVLDDGSRMNFMNEHFKHLCEKGHHIKITDKELLEKIKHNNGSVAGIEEIPKSLQEVFVTAHDIPWQRRLSMQGAAQKNITMSISSTVNLPNSATKHDVEMIYKQAWAESLKGITVYRDGSMDSQPVDFGSGTNKESTEKASVSSQSSSKKKRPQTLYGRTEKLKTGHGDLYLTINELDGQPFEVFAMLSKSGRTAAAKAEAIGRLVSLALRTGVEVDEIVSQLEGIGGDHQVFQEGGLVKSIPDGIARILKERYLNGTASWNENDANPIEDTEEPESTPYVSRIGAICPRCGQPSLRMDANCRGGECWNCFYSNCS